MPSVFSYLDYRSFLRDHQAERQLRHPSHSVRAFLQKADISSPSFFRQVVDGKRNLTPATTEKFLKALRLSETETQYFQALVLFTQANSSAEKQLHYARLRTLSARSKVHLVGEDSYRYYEFWYIPVIRELAPLLADSSDYTTMAKLVQPRITAAQAKSAMRLLLELGFLEEDAKGKLRQRNALLSTGFEVQSLAVRAFNRQMVELAANSLDTIPPAERSVSGVTFAASPHTFTLITEELRALQDRILTLVENDPAASRVYQMNLLVIPVSQQLSESPDKDS